MKENGKIVKIIYFDENSAMDYVNIMNEGEITQTNEGIVYQEKDTQISIGAKISAKLKFMKFLNAETKVASDIDLITNSKNIINSTITNTILTDYIKLATENSNSIKSFNNIKLAIFDDSFTELKLQTPYTYLISEKSTIAQDFAVNKFDSILEIIRGYYEFSAEDTIKNEKYIFRFNVNCLKNNYKLIDLLKMELYFYGVKVGRMNINDLKTQNELNLNKNKIKSSNEIYNEIFSGTKNEGNNLDEDIRDVYDIVLAGVIIPNEK